MAAPADLSELRINRDVPTPPARAALKRNLVLFSAALASIAAAVVVIRARAVPTVQVLTVSAGTGSNGSSTGTTSVTANGYVVARTNVVMVGPAA